MKLGKVRWVMVAAVLVIALLVPMVAMASGFVLEKSLIGGLFVFTTYTEPDVSGNNCVYLAKSTLVPGAKWQLGREDLRTGHQSIIASDTTFDIDSPAIDGDWVVWEVGGDIRAKNLTTGVVKKITNDALTTVEITPVVSGRYVVWAAFNGTDWDVWGKDLATSHAKFLVAGGSGNQSEPSIYGTRVAFRDASVVAPGAGQIKVKTIGSSAGPKLITSNLLDQNSPSIGSHLVAWSVQGIGHLIVKYYNYDDDTTSIAASADVDIFNPQVSGDRILYDYSNGTDKDTWIYDARAARGWPFPLAFPIDNTSGDEIWGKISGNNFVYLSNGLPYWGKLAVPSLSVGSVPTRIAAGTRITLKGKLSDMSVPVGGVSLDVERRSGNKWLKIKTITTTSSGAYSYSTPKNTVKTQYRVAYNGMFAFLGPTWLTHFSAVSSVRTAWPR